VSFMYADDEDLRHDHAEAEKRYRRAAEEGDAASQYNLGVLSQAGQGVPQDYGEAVKWYRMAADQGYANAQFNLGAMYVNGQGVPQNYVEAHKWFSLAASTFGDSEVKKRYTAINARDLTAAAMTPEQISEAEELARQWRPAK
jgi:TPR repeat protein